MSIGNIDRSSTFSSVTFSTPEAQAAVLLLENQDQQQDIYNQQLAGARDRYIAESKAEVAALHAEADDIRFGAMVEAGVMAVGVAVQTFAVIGEAECTPANNTPGAGWELTRGLGASATNGLGPTMDKWLGDAPTADDRAEGKRAETAAQQSQWELQDTTHQLQQSQGEQQQAVDWLSKLVDKSAQSSTAVLSDIA